MSGVETNFYKENRTKYRGHTKSRRVYVGYLGKLQSSQTWLRLQP